MAPKLYKYDMSSPTRAVYLTAKFIGIDLEFVETDLLAADQLKAEFLKLNPQHTVPTLVDGDNVIWDSHAINIYLVTKYGKDDSLYPADHYKRAIINQRLHFNGSVLFPLIKNTAISISFKQFTSIPKKITEQFLESYGFLEKFLEGHKWAAGNDVTLADFSLLCSASTLDVMVPISPAEYPNITAWMKRAQQLPYYYVTEKGLEDFKNFVVARIEI